MDFVFKFVAYKLREFIRTNIFNGRFLGWRSLGFRRAAPTLRSVS